jgi:hypothetical protein
VLYFEKKEKVGANCGVRESVVVERGCWKSVSEVMEGERGVIIN